MDAFKLDVLFFKEGDVWVGQCLQHDIAVQGESLRDCMHELRAALLGRVAIASEIGMEHPFRNIPPAPSKYWKRYRGALKLCPDESTFELPEGSPPAFIIDASNLEIRIDG